MYRMLFSALFASFIVASSGAAMAQSPKRITLDELEGMFASMRAKTTWKVDAPLLWGYFFFDPSAEALELAAMELHTAGYRVVHIEQVEGDSQFKLHVEKVETHSPASLFKRNTEFYALAARYRLASYDGMDVGPAPAGQ